MKPFLISFAQVSMLVNDDKTCSFLTMEIGQGYDKLKECLVSIDRVMTRHQLPVFYNPPRFHTSIAWSPHEFSLEKIPESVVDEIRYKEYSVRSIYIKTGNEVTQIPLT
ncbi:U6 snRNA phosphodiesterase Usb1 [Pilobolus umbonatus]|nr:U6 snRNA phosphodiesterase Usb1 [Pilobolus umbonatus]